MSMFARKQYQVMCKDLLGALQYVANEDGEVSLDQIQNRLFVIFKDDNPRFDGAKFVKFANEQRKFYSELKRKDSGK